MEKRVLFESTKNFHFEKLPWTCKENLVREYGDKIFMGPWTGTEDFIRRKILKKNFIVEDDNTMWKSECCLSPQKIFTLKKNIDEFKENLKTNMEEYLNSMMKIMNFLMTPPLHSGVPLYQKERQWGMAKIFLKEKFFFLWPMKDPITCIEQWTEDLKELKNLETAMEEDLKDKNSRDETMDQQEESYKKDMALKRQKVEESYDKAMSALYSVFELSIKADTGIRMYPMGGVPQEHTEETCVPEKSYAELQCSYVSLRSSWKIIESLAQKKKDDQCFLNRRKAIMEQNLAQNMRLLEEDKEISKESLDNKKKESRKIIELKEQEIIALRILKILDISQGEKDNISNQLQKITSLDEMVKMVDGLFKRRNQKYRDLLNEGKDWVASSMSVITNPIRKDELSNLLKKWKKGCFPTGRMTKFYNNEVGLCKLSVAVDCELKKRLDRLEKGLCMTHVDKIEYGPFSFKTGNITWAKRADMNFLDLFHLPEPKKPQLHLEPEGGTGKRRNPGVLHPEPKDGPGKRKKKEED